MENKKMKVAELFAGVGGFRLGLNKNNYEVVWSNQWEPSTKMQHASMVYEERFGKENHSNEDINDVVSRNVEEIPNHDLLVGGFPCQDYSVATTLHNSKGLKGKKGVLWWSIHKILENKKNKPKYLFLENVDRLLKSPAKQRGRDFAVMLQSLNDLGYAVEWRVINAGEDIQTTSGNDTKIETGKELEITSADKATFKSAKDILVEGGTGITIKDRIKVDIKAKKVTAKGEVGLKLEGKIVDIKGDATTNIKGTMLNLNC